eukprot:6164118-Karenia_brevis.AAC.1
MADEWSGHWPPTAGGVEMADADEGGKDKDEYSEESEVSSSMDDMSETQARLLYDALLEGDHQEATSKKIYEQLFQSHHDNTGFAFGSQAAQ